MAFSTQKEFYYVPFMNQSYDSECQEVCVKLKSYHSTVDDRSWAADVHKKSRFVADLIACNTPIDGRRVQGIDHGGVSSMAGPTKGINNRPSVETAKNRGGEVFSSSGSQSSGYGNEAVSHGAQYSDSLLDGDSLITAADATIIGMHELMVKNNILPRQIIKSDDKIKTSKNKNDDIKRILSQRCDPEKIEAIQKKIKKLADAKSISPADVIDLNDLQKFIEDMVKAHDILKAENAILRRLIEKQSKRCTMESLIIDPEKNNDIPFLQNKIDSLSKELNMLRKAEDKQLKSTKLGAHVGDYNLDSNADTVFSKDTGLDNINKIIAERNALRKKIEALSDLEIKVNELQQKANLAEGVSDDLSRNLNEQDQYINDMENEIQEMQKYYESEVDKSKCNEAFLKCRCDDMRQQLMTAKCAAQRAECQVMEIDVLRGELRKRDNALNAYDCQYQQLMNIVCDLNKKFTIRPSNCVGSSFECPDVGDDLAVYTGATLDHIMNELCNQADCFKQINLRKSPGAPHISSLDDCSRELDRLKDMIFQKDGQLDKLIEDNECLCQDAADNNNRLSELDRKVQQLDEDTKFMEDGMRESIGLIQDIGHVAKENDSLKDQLNNFKVTEANKLLKSYQDQLEECQLKMHMLQEINKKLSDALDNIGGDPKSIQKEFDERENLRKVDEKRHKQWGKIQDEDLRSPYLQDTTEIKKEVELGNKSEERRRDGPGENRRLEKTEQDESKEQSGVTPKDNIREMSEEERELGLKQKVRPDTNEKHEPKPIAKLDNVPEKLEKDTTDIPKETQKNRKELDNEKYQNQEMNRYKEKEKPEGKSEANRTNMPAVRGNAKESENSQDNYEEKERVEPKQEHMNKIAINEHGTLVVPVGEKPKISDASRETNDKYNLDGRLEKISRKTEIESDDEFKKEKKRIYEGEKGEYKKGEYKRVPMLPGNTSNSKSVQNQQLKGSEINDQQLVGSGKRNVRLKGTHEDDMPGDGNAVSLHYGRVRDRTGGQRRQQHTARDLKQNTSEQFDEFVKHTVQSLSAGEVDGVGLEKELRKILDMFIEECGFCFCKCNIPKSRFYAICHKLYHHGLHTLDFKELGYMHKRIFAAAENILPGCLFNTIIRDINSGKNISQLTPVALTMSNQQCCSCKSTLCCDPNEEKLMLKVVRLEQDIENAKFCLQNLKSIPSNLSISNYNIGPGDCTTE
ncbi:uncharacterized protein Dwil_GK23613 [Drosophila willistoni]|uniref:Coiled-coil Y protein n=2 Tax=Drosophila willistoni TaxID=7260 RepID=B4NEY0_DROWI|nr:coiled-coil Y protein [Drosophila willistoni]EDW82919.2 uncharacterized protein Dwil_GK23613 [Drosophila willistoni]